MAKNILAVMTMLKMLCLAAILVLLAGCHSQQWRCDVAVIEPTNDTFMVKVTLEERSGWADDFMVFAAPSILINKGQSGQALIESDDHTLQVDVVPKGESIKVTVTLDNDTLLVTSRGSARASGG